MGNNIAFYLTCANSYPGIPILFLMVAYGSRLPLGIRVVGSFLTQAAIMALMPATAPLSYWAPLSLMFLNGLSMMVLQSSLFGLQAMFPPILAQAAVGGQGVAGIIASGIQITVMASAQAAGQTDNARTAVICFAFAAVLLCLCAVMYVWLAVQPFTTFYLARTAEAQRTAAAAACAGVDGAELGQSKGAREDSEEEGAALVGGSSPPSSSRGVCGRELAVLRKTWRGVVGVFLIYTCTFMLFPGLMDTIPYRGGLGARAEWISSNGWWPVLLLAIFNVADTVGRMAPARVICLSEASLVPLTLFRFAFIAWFLACTQSWVVSSLAADLLAVSAVFVLGVSNGYLTALAIMFGPARAATDEKETAGFMLSLMLNLGIMAGSQLALAFT